ncbi:hypothetical protein ACOSQ3_012052 [Xanthoceras sorbifolium]
MRSTGVAGFASFSVGSGFGCRSAGAVSGCKLVGVAAGCRSNGAGSRSTGDVPSCGAVGSLYMWFVGADSEGQVGLVAGLMGLALVVGLLGLFAGLLGLLLEVVWSYCWVTSSIGFFKLNVDVAWDKDSGRGTNVLEGEAGFLTQQIGATYFPAENIRERTKELKADAKMKVPVVDIIEGLKPQTIESLNLLKMRNTEFIVALNKVDRLYGWKMCRNAPIVKALKQQSKDVRNQFKMKLIEVKYTFSHFS